MIVMRALAGIVVALAAIAVILSYAGTLQLQGQITRQQVIVECQANYAQAFREALLARDKASTLERNAQRELLTEAMKPGSTDPAVLRRYLNALTEVEEIRAETPLPAENYCQLEPE